MGRTHAVAVNVMFTSGGRESFGGPNVILCTQEVNALLEATVRL
jgi:hypothetical protein